MYETFFGLSDLPFRLTPDPKYLFMSAKHREAFAHLVYGISEGSGFVAITGEVGAGKTTLIRALLAEHSKDVTVASIVNPVLTSTELLQTINAELGLPSRSTSRKELMEELAAFLKSNNAAGRRTVIIVDEAQNLDPVVLEQLRLLTNLETETEKLLQVVLVGQPELHGTLQRHDLRQLNQRVTERWHLDKLDRDEAMEYVRHRLRVAGAQTELVEPKALELMYRFTDGVPRLLNVLSHRSMLVAFTRSRGRVGAEEVAAAARELGYTPQVAAASGPSWTRMVAGLVAIVGVAAVAYLLVHSFAADDSSRPRQRASQPSAPVAKLPAAPVDVAVVAAEAAALAERNAQAAAQAAAGDAALTQAADPSLAGAGDAATADAAMAATAQAAAQVGEGAAVPSAAEAATEDVPEAAPVEVAAVAVAAATAPEKIDDAATLAALAGEPVFDAAVADFSRLLQLWGVAPVGAGDLNDGSLDFATIAASRGVRYFSVQLNDALLAELDLPAVVEMNPSPDGEVRYVFLRTLDRTANTVRLGNDLAMTLPAFDAAWNGTAHILFKDPEGLRFDQGPGSGGPAVRKLQSMLASVGVMDTAPTGLYDAITENAVRQFQESRHVTTDGVTGPITQILLYNSLARFERPTLAAGSGFVAARPQGDPS